MTKFYRGSYKTEEICNLGCKHSVYYYEVVEVTLLDSQRVTVDYGGTPVDSVNQWWVDTEGMIYFRQATWDGPDWPVDEEGNVWVPRPVGEVKKDLEGNLL